MELIIYVSVKCGRVKTFQSLLSKLKDANDILVFCYSSAASLLFPTGYMHSVRHCLMISLKQKNIDTVMIAFNHKIQSIQ